MIVLDASAVLAFLKRETGWDVVVPLLPGAVMSTVNLAEVLAKVVDAGRDPETVRRSLEDQGITYSEATSHQALRVATLQPQARQHDLSYADRFAVALAEEVGGELITSDDDLSRLPCGARITKFR